MINRSRVWFGASLLFMLTTQISNMRGQGLDQLLNTAVGIDVFNSNGEKREFGSGFAIAADRSTVTVLTARHLFYPGRDAFRGKVSVTFSVDKLNAYPAELLENSSAPLDLAALRVENVPQSIAAKLPLIAVRPNSLPPSIEDSVRIFAGKDLDWQVASGTVSDRGEDKSTEGFRYVVTGVAPGFSGSPVFDGKGLLLGIHLGTDLEGRVGRAMRMDRKVYEVLSERLGVTMNKLNFNVIPNLPAPANGGSPDRKSYDEMRQNAIDTITARTAGVPELFGKIDVSARKVGKWQLTVWAWGKGVQSNYYDVKLEAILRGVGNGSQSASVSDLRLAGQPHKYTALVDDLGKSAVVCFTGTPNPSYPRPQRLTAWFSIDVNGNVATFSPSRPAALEPASEAPCDPNFSAPAEASTRTVSQTNPEQSLQNAAPVRVGGRQVGSIAQPSGGVGLDPANFAAIHVIASLRQQKWTLNVMALQVGMHRDTSLQVVVVDATDHLKALPVSRENVMHSTSSRQLLDELGKGVVVCYTAIDDSAKGQAFRMTSWFTAQAQGNRATFVPLRPATLAQASDAPCQ